MKSALIIFGVFLINSIIIVKCQKTNVINCYYESWTKYRNGDGNFPINRINANLCTHITYTFIGLNADGSINQMDAQTDMADFLNLRKQNPKVKLLIAMGGWNEGSATYSTVTNNPTLRTTMINNIYNFVKTNNLDGFDLDWEYPAQRGGVPSDKVSLISFLSELRSKFAGTNWLITTAVSAAIQNFQASYDVPNMNKYVDYFNVMAYDYHGSWDAVTGQNAPLYHSNSNPNDVLNVNASILGWIAAGASQQKLLLGTGFYGRSFTLASTTNTKLGAPISGAGNPGPFTQQAGMLDYLEICDNFYNEKWTVVFDNQQKVPYAYSGDQWVGYDNPKSLQMKIQYALNMKLGGVMIWSIDSDDAINKCGTGKYPLLNAIYNTMFPAIATTITTPRTSPTAATTTTTRTVPTVTQTATTPRTTPTLAQPTTTTRLTTTSARPTTTTAQPNTLTTATSGRPTTTTIRPTTTTSQTVTTTTKTTQKTTTKKTTAKTTTKPRSNKCESLGSFRHSTNCHYFYTCIDDGFGGFIQYTFQCPSNLVYSEEFGMCLYPDEVDCN